MKIFAALARLLKDERGVAAIEYALVVSLVSLVCIAALTNLGQQMNITFLKIASAVNYTTIP